MAFFAAERLWFRLERPHHRVRSTRELIADWDRYAGEVPLAPEQYVHSPDEAVRLMNEYSARAFPESSVRFRLWHSGERAPIDYVINAKAEPWTRWDQLLDAYRRDPSALEALARAREEGTPLPDLKSAEPSATAQPVTLYDETTSYLFLHDYVSRWLDDDVWFFRQDAFEPHLQTRNYFVLDEKRFMASASAPGAPRRISLRPFLDDLLIRYIPSSTAEYDTRGRVVILRLDDEAAFEADRAFHSHNWPVAYTAMERFRINALAWVELKKLAIVERYRELTSPPAGGGGASGGIMPGSTFPPVP